MENLKKLRKIHEATQQTVADHLGITRSAYSNIENDNRDPDTKTLLKLADYYNVSVDYLLGRETQKKEPAAIFEDERQAELNAIFERMPDEESKDKLIQLVRSFEITNKYEIGHRYIGGIAAKGGNKPIIHRIPPKKK